MICNASLFSDISNSASPSFVTIGNGSKSPVHGIGTVRTSSLTFSSVLDLPQFPYNLLSVHKLTSILNCSITFYPTRCVFQDLKTKDKEEERWSLLLSLSMHIYHIPSSYQWHFQLGHHSANNLRCLVPVLPSSNFNCDTCK